MTELCQLDAAKAQAGKNHEEADIKAAILQNGGFAEVNSRCQMGIQGALVNIAKAAMTEDSFMLMNGLGQLLVGQAKYDEALAWYEKALAGFVGKGDEENTATTYGHMAFVYKNQGEYEKALEWYEKGLAIKLKTLGPDHPSTATSYGHMGSVYDDQGEYEKALEWYEKGLAIDLKTLGPDHPSTAISYGNMAGVYDDQGEYEKALSGTRKG